VAVLHRGPLTEAQQALIDSIADPQQTTPANIAVRAIDVDDRDAAGTRELLASLSEPPLPTMVVQYPAHLRIDAPVWTEPFDEGSFARLTGSPIRRELIRRLADGQTAVWLQLDGGNASADEASAALVHKELNRLERELKLPALTESPEDALLGGPPLKLKFSVLRLSRDDPAEAALVSMLVKCEEDLAERTDPIVFPVFGRGRALLPLVGAGITPENIHGSAAFLVGPCSCQVKELNPGFDLLLAADWGALLSLEYDPAALLASAESAEPELVPIAPGSPVIPSEPSAPAASTPPSASTERTGPPWTVISVLALAAALIVVAMRTRS
jgi:hypothetical protein